MPGPTARTKTAYTFAAASPAGYANDIAYVAPGYVLGVALTAGDGASHPVVILGNAATNHSAKTFTITGTDANGVTITETLAGPNGNVTVTSVRFYKTLVSVTIDSTTGADTFDIGWTALAHTPWEKASSTEQECKISVAVVVGGTINYDVEHTYDVPTDAASTAFKHSGITSKTANDDGQYIAPVQAVRMNVNSHTSGTATFYALQGG